MQNKVFLIGNLGADPELRYTTGGKKTPVANLSVATNERWTDDKGEKHEKVTWHRVIVWNKLAEACAKHLTKGRLVSIEGKITNRSWVDEKNNNITRYTTEIVAQNVQFLPSGSRNGAGDPGPSDDQGAPMADIADTSMAEAGPDGAPF